MRKTAAANAGVLWCCRGAVGADAAAGVVVMISGKITAAVDDVIAAGVLVGVVVVVVVVAVVVGFAVRRCSIGASSTSLPNAGRLSNVVG